jgi:hypothetical protein
VFFLSKIIHAPELGVNPNSEMVDDFN